MNNRSPADDRREIYDVVMRYCRGIDRVDMDLLRSAYHRDGIDHHTGFSGSIDQFTAWVSTALRRFNGTMHLIGNHSAIIDRDKAVVESYGSAIHWGNPPDDPRVNFTTGFRYIDHMEYRDGRWAIVVRWAVREWTRSDAGRFVTKEGAGPAGARGADLANDPLYVLARSLGIALQS
jgi:hypothetical protein